MFDATTWQSFVPALEFIPRAAGDDPEEHRNTLLFGVDFFCRGVQFDSFRLVLSGRFRGRPVYSCMVSSVADSMKTLRLGR